MLADTTISMTVLSYLVFCIVISRSFAIYTYTFVPEYAAITPYSGWQVPQNNQFLYPSFVTAPASPLYGAAPAHFARTPLNYLPAAFRYTTYPSLQYYSTAIEDRKTVNPYSSVETQKLRTIPSDEEVDSQETSEIPTEESTLLYQELLRAQLYRQLQEIKKAFRLRKVFEKVNTS